MAKKYIGFFLSLGLLLSAVPLSGATGGSGTAGGGDDAESWLSALPLSFEQENIWVLNDSQYYRAVDPRAEGIRARIRFDSRRSVATPYKIERIMTYTHEVGATIVDLGAFSPIRESEEFSICGAGASGLVGAVCLTPNAAIRATFAGIDGHVTNRSFQSWEEFFREIENRLQVILTRTIDRDPMRAIAHSEAYATWSAPLRARPDPWARRSGLSPFVHLAIERTAATITARSPETVISDAVMVREMDQIRRLRAYLQPAEGVISGEQTQLTEVLNQAASRLIEVLAGNETLQEQGSEHSIVVGPTLFGPTFRDLGQTCTIPPGVVAAIQTLSAENPAEPRVLFRALRALAFYAPYIGRTIEYAPHSYRRITCYNEIESALFRSVAVWSQQAYVARPGSGYAAALQLRQIMPHALRYLAGQFFEPPVVLSALDVLHGMSRNEYRQEIDFNRLLVPVAVRQILQCFDRNPTFTRAAWINPVIETSRDTLGMTLGAPADYDARENKIRIQPSWSSVSDLATFILHEKIHALDHRDHPGRELSEVSAWTQTFEALDYARAHCGWAGFDRVSEMEREIATIQAHGLSRVEAIRRWVHRIRPDVSSRE